MPWQEIDRKLMMSFILSCICLVCIVFAINKQASHLEIRVAIIDDGIDSFHPALNNISVERHSLSGFHVNGGGHGTGMASIFVNGLQSDGSHNIPSIEILDIPVLDEGGIGKIEDLVAAIEIAADQSAHLIVMSLGVEVNDPALEASVRRALSQGIVIVAAAGNGIGNFQRYPASYDGVISVGALNAEGHRLRFTNEADVNLLAPGEKLSGAASDGQADTYTGTSPATAFAAARITSCWQRIDAQSIDSITKNTHVTNSSAIEEARKEPAKCDFR